MTIAEPAKRIISLVPSATETLVGWGAAPIACTRFCEQPEIDTVGGTKDPDIDAIVELGPDLVVMCPEENRATDAEAIEAAGLTVHVCSPRRIEEVPAALAELAAAAEVEPPRLLMGHPPDDLLPVGPGELRAFIPIWRRPWMTFTDGTYATSLLRAIGVRNIAAEIAPPGDEGPEGAASRYPTVDLAAVEAAPPDVILAPSEPYSFRPRHLDELRRIAPVIPIDGQDLFWWGARSTGAVLRLALVIATGLADQSA